MKPPTTSNGKLSMRIPTRRLTIGAVVDFLAAQLPEFPSWQNTAADQNENYYNQRLDRFLQIRARRHLDAIQVARETIHLTPGSHDIGVFPSDEEGLVVRTKIFGPAEPLYTIECKRLPSPRGREYITSEAGHPPRGAIQRYKLCIHGAALDDAAVIGYVQRTDPEVWRKVINQWISDLARSPVDSASWSASERLQIHRRFRHTKKILVSKSESTRSHGRKIRLTHFFVDLRADAQPELRLG